MMDQQTVVGIIGGTGLYDIDGLLDVEEFSAATPFGPPSSPITTGTLEGVRMCFLARHGRGHVLLPSEINYRANIYALKQLGAQWCISVSAVGSLQEQITPGDLVLPDQYIDRTTQRSSTFFGRGIAAHVPFASPVCPVLAKAAADAAAELTADSLMQVHTSGTYVCMEGPQFSTRAESHLYRSWGASLIGMTALPEAKLAREAELAYATLAMVTDYDCWRHSDADVDVGEILATMQRNVLFARKLIRSIVLRLKELKPSPMAANALAMGIITPLEQVPEPVKQDLHLIIGKYLEK